MGDMSLDHQCRIVKSIFTLIHRKRGCRHDEGHYCVTDRSTNDGKDQVMLGCNFFKLPSLAFFLILGGARKVHENEDGDHHHIYPCNREIPSGKRSMIYPVFTLRRNEGAKGARNDSSDHDQGNGFCFKICSCHFDGGKAVELIEPHHRSKYKGRGAEKCKMADKDRIASTQSSDQSKESSDDEPVAPAYFSHQQRS